MVEDSKIRDIIFEFTFWYFQYLNVRVNMLNTKIKQQIMSNNIENYFTHINYHQEKAEKNYR